MADERLLLRLELDALYADYVACLDEERFEEWPNFFTDDAVYKIVPRGNFERGLPLATWLCEGRGYLTDRVAAIRKTSVYGPRRIRRQVANIRVIGDTKRGQIETRANFSTFETLPDELTRVFVVGQCRDLVVRRPGGLKFDEKICVFDTELVPNSLIYPI